MFAIKTRDINFCGCVVSIRTLMYRAKPRILKEGVGEIAYLPVVEKQSELARTLETEGV